MSRNFPGFFACESSTLSWEDSSVRNDIGLSGNTTISTLIDRGTGNPFPPQPRRPTPGNALAIPDEGSIIATVAMGFSREMTTAARRGKQVGSKLHWPAEQKTLLRMSNRRRTESFERPFPFRLRKKRQNIFAHDYCQNDRFPLKRWTFRRKPSGRWFLFNDDYFHPVTSASDHRLVCAFTPPVRLLIKRRASLFQPSFLTQCRILWRKRVPACWDNQVPSMVTWIRWTKSFPNWQRQRKKTAQWFETTSAPRMIKCESYPVATVET